MTAVFRQETISDYLAFQDLSLRSWDFPLILGRGLCNNEGEEHAEEAVKHDGYSDEQPVIPLVWQVTPIDHVDLPLPNNVPYIRP